MYNTILLGLLLLTFVAVGCSQAEQTEKTEAEAKSETAAEEATPADTGAAAEEAEPTDTVDVESGLRYIVLKEGEGKPAEKGMRVSMHYTGWFMTDEGKKGDKFDSSRDRGKPFAFPLGAGRVIKGWDLGVPGMKPGEQRRLIIPYQLAYGERGHPAGIPPKADLIFDVEYLGPAEK